MKNISKAKKIILAIIPLVIIVGIVMLFIVGFNKGMIYQKGTKIEVMISNGYDKAEVEKIAKEVFSNRKIFMQDIEKTNQVVSVKVENYTQEELDNFKTKIGEKYGIEKENLEVHKVLTPATRISTIVSPYIVPVSLVTAISILYIAIKNIKEKEIAKKIVTLLTMLISVAGLYFSIIIIARIPVTELTMPIALALYVVTLLITTIKRNKELIDK